MPAKSIIIIYQYTIFNSKMEIVTNPKMKLNTPEFNCDLDPLGTHLNAYPMLSHLNAFSFTAIIGRPGQGKTSLMISMLTGKKEKRIFNKAFNHVIVVMPTCSRNSIKKNPFKNHPPEKMYEELDYHTMNDIYEKLLASSAEKERTLLILDDVTAMLKNKDIGKLLRLVIYNRRHLKVHICILVQSYIAMPKEIRKLITNAFIFKPSLVEMENLMTELFEMKRDTSIELMQFAYNKPHQYLMLNVENQKIYRDFDEILIPEENAEKSAK